MHEAASSGLNHREFLELLLQDELLIRNHRLLNRRTMAAGFREPRRLEDFDFGFNPSIKKDRVFDLASCKFVRERRDVLLVGPPGTGKSHLAQALGLAAIRSGFTVYYRSIFDTVRDFLQDEALAGQRDRRGRAGRASSASPGPRTPTGRRAARGPNDAWGVAS